jgi:voltage-gated sodium channel
MIAPPAQGVRMNAEVAVSPRMRLLALVESAPFRNSVMTLIVLNAITLGLESSRSIMQDWGETLHLIDRVVLWIFTVELILRIIAHGPRFFRDGWNLFDFCIVAIAYAPATESMSVLRAMRVLRVFRLVAAVPSMRIVVEALLRSLPGLGSIFALLLLIFYVFAVMATKLFGETNMEKFGTLSASLFTLFQLMTLDGWAGEIVNPVLEHHANAMAFFLPFIVLSTFVVLNLFIALIVDSMQRIAKADDQDETSQIIRKVDALAKEVQDLRQALADNRRP